MSPPNYADAEVIYGSAMTSLPIIFGFWAAKDTWQAQAAGEQSQGGGGHGGAFQSPDFSRAAEAGAACRLDRHVLEHL